MLQQEAFIGPDGKLEVKLDTRAAKEMYGDTDHRYARIRPEADALPASPLHVPPRLALHLTSMRQNQSRFLEGIEHAPDRLFERRIGREA